MKLLRTLSSLGIIAMLVACASTPQDPAVGDWSFDFETPNGQRTATVMIANDGTGSFASEQLGDVEISNLAIGDNSIAFVLENTLAGFPLEFSGTVEGDAMTGEFGTPMGALPVTGTRTN